ncbi:alpha,alpha-trehalase nth1 [Cryptotrichosporon argae]
MASPLRSTRSRLNPRVTLVTLGSNEATGQPAYTSLRRATRSQATSAIQGDGTARLALEGYAYRSPKRLKREPSPITPAKSSGALLKAEPASPTTPLRAVKPENADAIAPAKGEGSTPRSAKKSQVTAARTKAHPAPAKWEEQYRLIERMRAGIVAPVDDMGCERPRTTDGLDAKTLRFHILISLMLSSQTKDAVTSQAVTNLHLALPGGLTATSLAAADPSLVSEAINKVGFWRRKTDYIQEAARRLLERGGEDSGDVPKSIEELCELRGVGPKMAFLALQWLTRSNAGIGVDVHVHRITNRLKWHKPPTQTPEQTRVNLESWLPAQFHKPINPMLVGFGQAICLPIGPRCDICLLGQRALCPSRTKVDASKRKEVHYTFTADDGDGAVHGLASVNVAYEQDGGDGAGDVKLEAMEDVLEEVKEEVKEEVMEEVAEELKEDLGEMIGGEVRLEE